MTKQIRDALGQQFSGYQAFTYPTNNFGVGTAYVASGNQVNDADFLCDSWNCLGVTSPPTDATAELSMNGFAAVGDHGGTISLDQSTSSNVAMSVLLPAIFKALNMQTSFNRSMVTNTTLDIGQAYPRELRRLQFLPYVSGLPQSNPLKQAFDEGRLAVVVGDVVISHFQVTIQATQSTSAALDAKLPTTGVPQTSFSGSTLSGTIAKTAAGKYTITVSQPVVVLRLVKHQPAAGTLAADSTWDAWRTVSGKAPSSAWAASRHVPLP